MLKRLRESISVSNRCKIYYRRTVIILVANWKESFESTRHDTLNSITLLLQTERGRRIKELRVVLASRISAPLESANVNGAFRIDVFEWIRRFQNSTKDRAPKILPTTSISPILFCIAEVTITALSLVEASPRSSSSTDCRSTGPVSAAKSIRSDRSVYLRSIMQSGTDAATEDQYSLLSLAPTEVASTACNILVFFLIQWRLFFLAVPLPDVPSKGISTQAPSHHHIGGEVRYEHNNFERYLL